MLGRGDTLVLHTDGVTEAMSPTQELFGDERLLHALKESRALALGEMRRHLLAQIHAHRAGAPLSDDLTLLLLRRLEAAAGDVTQCPAPGVRCRTEGAAAPARPGTTTTCQ
jgi:hypothetical protein